MIFFHPSRILDGRQPVEDASCADLVRRESLATTSTINLDFFSSGVLF
jgi:hypothetical protein